MSTKEKLIDPHQPTAPPPPPGAPAVVHRSIESPGGEGKAGGGTTTQTCIQHHTQEYCQVARGVSPDECSPILPQTADIKWCSTKWSHIILTATTVVLATGWVLSLPLCTAGLIRIDSDVYSAVVLGPLYGFLQCLWLTLVFMFCLDHNIYLWPSCLHEALLELVIGAFNTLSCVLQVYSSVPWRTHPHLQVLLQTCSIPFTVLLRYVILRQGLNFRQAVCVSLVLFGLAISIVPQIIPIAGPHTSIVQPNDQLLLNNTIVTEERPLSTFDRIFWATSFAASYLPFAAMCVFAEVGAKTYEYHPLNLCMFMQLFSCLGGLFLFWSDILPYFGMADSIAEFRAHQSRALSCIFFGGSGSDCSYVRSRMWFYMWSNSASFISQFFLIGRTQGAVYSVLVLALTLPVGTLFWSLVSDDGSLFWDPKFGKQTIFSISGIFLLVPPIVLYDYFGLQADDEIFKELK